MKLIKTVRYFFQFGLVGLVLAVVYMVSVSDKSQSDIVAFFTSTDQQRTSQPVSPAVGPVFSYADSVDSSSSSVVTIYTSKNIKEKNHPLLDDPIFSQYFGDQLKRHQRSRSEINLGSGVLIGAEGYILTNQHVIDGADEILISLKDGRGSQAVLIGEDKDTDLAVLQIPLHDLQGIMVSTQKLPRVGDVVLTIGNPLNVGQTVTMGIISATGRNHLGLSTFENFIQTDAAINPGNSGGALINARGELIGINTAIFNRANGAEGIGFAIPISTALDIMQQILANGKVTRGWLGVGGSEVTASAAMGTGNPSIRGALIDGVFINSPADRAGIRAGDVVVAVDSKPVLGIRDLLDQVTRHKPGQRILISIYRGKKTLDLSVQVSERPR